MDSRERIQQLRDFLRQQSFLPEDVATWGAAALTRYLSGAESSLDHAFGLVQANHRPPETERRFDLAAKAEDMRQAGKSWKTISDSFHASDELVKDQRGIRRLVNEFKNDLMAREIGNRLASNKRGP